MSSAPTSSAPAALTEGVEPVPSPSGDGERRDETDSPLAAARRLSHTLLAPLAEATDQADVVPGTHLRALAGAGLYGLFRPPGRPVAESREVLEILAGACGVTFFTWFQHHSPVQMLARSANQALRDRHLDGLCDGRVLGGVAFSYLRQGPPHPVVARRVPGGYRVDGKAPWVTGWGLAGIFAVGARLGDAVLFFVLDGRPSDAVRPSPPLALAAMRASCTVRLAFVDLFVPDDDVVSVVPFEQWQAGDRVTTAQPSPAAFGVAATCVRLLADHAEETAAALAGQLDECRRRSHALADAGRTDPDHLATQVEARADSLELAVRSATALVAAVGGRAMALDHPGQRLLREAAFYTIQAATPARRQALLAQLAAARS